MGPNNIVLDAFYSLGSKINKLRGSDNTETEQGIVSPKFPELTLEMDNDEIIKTTNKWNSNWTESDVYAKWSKESGENENYWLGKHFTRPEIDKTRSMVDNAIFEALETYLPQVTRRNPEASVNLVSEVEQADKEKQKFAQDLTKKLGVIADEVRLRLKLKKSARHWAIYLLGMVKVGWDLDRDMPSVKVIRVKKLILDPQATVDEDGYTGEYIGEHRKLEASKLISILEGSDAEEGAVEYIKNLVKNELGTEVGFIEWWTDEYTCWTLDKEVLLKKKNMHWNYDTEVVGEAVTDPATGEAMIDPTTGQPAVGEPTQQKGYNHFTVPKKPYIALSVFNLGKQPVDDTSLIGQNLANQDIVNKRNKQIDKNADSMNGAIAVSLERAGLTKEQAQGMTKAVQKGGVIAIPSGSVQDAVLRLAAPALPPDIYNQLADVRNRIKDIFGTRGSSAAGLSSDTTVRGKIMNRTLDSDRIGGGFSEYLEQQADDIYNWMVQLLYVYDDVYANGQPKPRVNVSVKEGSLLPKDSTTIANQAIELSSAGKMSLIDLYKRLDYPNPEELAANVWLEVNAPDVLYGNDERIAQVMKQKQEQAQAAQTEPIKSPSMSISYKDLPPDGQAQLAEKVGIIIHPEAIAAYNEFNKIPSDLPIKPTDTTG